MSELNTIGQLRLAALQAKGYTAGQIAEIAAAMEEALSPLIEHSDSPHAPAGAEENVIVSVKRNGVAVPPVDKIVDIAVPTKVSEMDNDSGFVTGEEVDEAVSGSGHLKHSTVDELPNPSVADANTIYFLRKNNSEAGKQYTPYKLINGILEIVGSAEAELEGYATVESVEKADDALITSIFNTVASSSEKYVGTGNLAVFWGLLKPLLTAHDSSITDLVARVELLELILNSDVSGNPFTVTFNTLDGVTASGVWNSTDGRIEF